MSEYFVRYSDSLEWLQDDLERGYSFHSYQFASSVEELLEEAGYDLDECDVNELAEELNVLPHGNGSYGFGLSGLCGFGPFESVEQAEEETRNGSYGAYTVRGIFEGSSAGLDPDTHVLFHPYSLVKVIA